MTSSLRTTITTEMRSLALTTARVLARMAIIIGVLMALVALGKLGSTDTPAPLAPVPTPAAPVQAPAGQGDGVADHHLFNDTATLDTSRIDDLRADPESQCLMQDKVMTSAGECVAGVRVWRDEVDTATWNALVGQGYLTSVQDPDSLWIPLYMVDLDGDDIAAVHLDRI